MKKYSKKSASQHDADVSNIQTAVQQWYTERASGNGEAHICNARPPGKTNMTRAPTYKKSCRGIDTSKLNAVIDVSSNLCICEPLVTMEQLFHATYESGTIPAVLPEFRSITVGGAVTGAGLESTSHKYGHFMAICSWVDVLLGNGSLIRCSSTQNADLWAGLPGSYGTMGFVVQIAVQLVPAAPYVRLHYQAFTELEMGLTAIKALCNGEHPPDVVEGLAVNDGGAIVIAGEFISQADADALRKSGLHECTTGRRFDDWFFRHAMKLAFGLPTKTMCCFSRSASVNPSLAMEMPSRVFAALSPNAPQEIMPIEDYLFRHDWGAFWMAATLAPNCFCMCLLHDCFSSTSMYKQLHKTDDDEVLQQLLVQDFVVKMSQVSKMIYHITRLANVWPLWLCPLRAPSIKEPLSPGGIGSPGELVVNIGMYGEPTLSGDGTLALLEEDLFRLGGRKMFYAHTLARKSSFWSTLDKAEYQRLRAAYSGKSFTGLFHKAVRKMPPSGFEDIPGASYDPDTSLSISAPLPPPSSSSSKVAAIAPPSVTDNEPSISSDAGALTSSPNETQPPSVSRCSETITVVEDAINTDDRLQAECVQEEQGLEESDISVAISVSPSDQGAPSTDVAEVFVSVTVTSISTVQEE